ncbi:MAG TPA: undecaprenyldiphospho-muramoylpentapeptide beta-N-acetylglucosaminyltransferase [Verrucomicrobiae bacterium]|jgi:UDP-N-acetylglucosamine--N-acetylmuramyl-(pentapeptide) pyrophosphoryl-undecaprenol N-acetylglucosamine transferase
MPEMPAASKSAPSAVIACGGTGGHLFPGQAVGEEMRRRGCEVTLMVSSKEVDQQAIASISDMKIVTLPAVGMTRGGWMRFWAGFWKSYRLARRLFAEHRPDVVLAMGGFVSAPPALAGCRVGAKTFLHESNSIPGRANRWLARWVDGAFVYFPSATQRLRAKRVEAAGMPVRPQFLRPLAAAEAKISLGLNPNTPLLLIMGGSQGASRVNDLVMAAAPLLRQSAPDLRFMHLTGARDLEKVRAGYTALGIPALTRAFFDDMGTALAAAEIAVSRAGASSLAELAARQLPAVLIPYPTAADNHQHFNALAFAQNGAARLVAQDTATPESLAREILNLLGDEPKRSAMRRALTAWQSPAASACIAERILQWDTAAEQARAAAVPKQWPALTC